MPRGDIRGFLESHMLCIPVLWGLRSLFRAPNCTFVLFFLPPSMVDLVSIGTVCISTDLVSVMVFGRWLLLAELPWIPAFPAQDLWPKAKACPGIAPTLIGTIPKLIYWQ